MSLDIRSDAATYYDDYPSFPKDIPFYVENLPSPEAKVLELGCGTGRVTLPLSQACHSIRGIDLSEAMITICREKIAKHTTPPTNISVEVGDITDLTLNQKFDLIIAPYRVFQNLETDAQVAGFFDSVRNHLAAQGRCILNVFKPNRDRETLQREWCTDGEQVNWTVPIDGGKITCYDRRPRMDKERLILYPELIYRCYEDEVVVDEAILKITMRCYYPQEFEELIVSHGFSIKTRWGGYNGEVYGQGPELVVEFEDGV